MVLGLKLREQLLSAPEAVEPLGLRRPEGSIQYSVHEALIGST